MPTSRGERRCDSANVDVQVDLYVPAGVRVAGMLEFPHV
jgi:hypothetical protein